MTIFLQILLLISTAIVSILAIAFVPDLSECNDPGGVGCVYEGIIRFALIGSTAILISICIFVLWKTNLNENSFFGKAFIIALLVVIGFFAYTFQQQSEIIQAEQKVQKPFHKEKTLLQKHWENIADYAYMKDVLSNMSNLQKTYYDDEYNALRLGVAMHHYSKDTANVNNFENTDKRESNNDPLFSPLFQIDFDRLSSMRILHYYLANDHSYLDNHKKYQRLFSLIKQLKLIQIITDGHENEHYRELIVRFLSFEKMVSNQYYDLVDDSISLLRADYKNSLIVAKSIKNESIKHSVISLLVNNYTSSQHRLKKIITSYDLLKDEKAFNEYFNDLLSTIVGESNYSCLDESNGKEELKVLFDELSGDYPKLKELADSLERCYRY